VLSTQGVWNIDKSRKGDIEIKVRYNAFQGSIYIPKSNIEEPWKPEFNWQYE
jgi:hypothetical protein